MRQRLAVADPVEVVVVRTTTTAAPPETAVLRLIGLLPADWECWQRVGKDRITLRVRGGGRDGDVDVDVDVRGLCAVVLRDRALEGWAIESGDQDPGPGDVTPGASSPRHSP